MPLIARLDIQIRMAIAIIALGLSANVCYCQVITSGTQTGLPAFGTFHGGDIDVVSLQNYSLHAEIPILSIPQRGGHNHE
jgi:hypothetical protein